MTALRPYLGRLPTLGQRVYLDPAATVIGDVHYLSFYSGQAPDTAVLVSAVPAPPPQPAAK